MKNRTCKRLGSIILTAIMAVAFMIPAPPAKAAEKEYDVIFRAGSQGTIGGQKSVEISVPYGTILSQYDTEIESIINSVAANDNYIFTGFESHGQNLNEVTVDKKTIFVAKYKRAIDALEYKINFIDTEGNAVATATAGMANRGDRVQIYARNIEGYTTATQTQEVTITENGQEINVVYQANDPGTITEVEEVTQVRPGTTTPAEGTTADGAAAGGTTAGTTTPDMAGGETAAADGGATDEGETTIEEDETPLADDLTTDDTDGTVEIEEDETPLAEDTAKEEDSNNYGLGIGVAAIAVVVLAGIIIAVKKRKDV